MILDHINNSASCESLHSLFPAAFEHFRELAARAELPEGRIELDGDRLYALVVDGYGKTKGGARTETHRRYIDIQFTAAGSDLIGWMPAGDCREPQGYDEAKDVEFYKDIPEQWIPVPAGQFAIFLPHDAHAPMAGDGAVKKIVIKVAVEPIPHP
jgi:YhcH/YjgK/YiaL family protein